MPKTSDELTAIAVKNQFLLEAAKNGLSKDFEPFLRDIEKDIRNLLSSSGAIITTKKHKNEITAEAARIQKEIYESYLLQLNSSLLSVGVQQAGMEAKSYEKVVVNFSSTVPDSAVIARAYNVNPLQVEDYAGNQLLDSFLRDTTKKEISRVNNAITTGFSQGQTNQQIITNIRGTKANNFRDGILSKTNRSIKGIVRTSVQHVAMQSQIATMKANDDLVKGYKLVVTFDSRTTTLCMDLGQQNKTYKVGRGPVPPLHFGCRDAIEPVIDSRFDFLDQGAKRASKGASGGAAVDAKLGSYEWMLTQPKTFQDASLGVTRAKLLRDGGLTPTEFAKLSTNSRLHTLTLAEMRTKAPSVFEKAGL